MLPLRSLPKRLLFSEASFTLPARLRVGDIIPERCNAFVTFRVGDLIVAIGLTATLILDRLLRMRGRSYAAGIAVALIAWIACAHAVLEVVMGVGVVLSSRSTGSTGLDGMGTVEQVGVDTLATQGARRPDEKKAE